MRPSILLTLAVWAALAACSFPVSPATSPARPDSATTVETGSTVPALPESETAPAAAATPVPTTPSATPVGSPTLEPTARPNPLSVSIHADASLRANAVITQAGGSLSATAPDGTRFTLTLPAGALLEPTEMMLTPVSAVDGLPFSGGLVAAVQLGPEGLTFFKAATLTIETTGADSPGGFETVGFAAHGDGHEFHLHPAEVQGARNTIGLTHFSDYGSLKATPAEIRRQKQERPPTSRQDRRDQEQVGERRGTVWQRAFDAQWFAELQPRLEAAASDETILREVLGEYLAWEQAVGQSKEFAGEIDLAWRLLAKGILNAINRSYQKCVDNRDPSRIWDISFWLMVADLPPESYISKAALAAAEDKLQNCATFELAFHSELDMTWENTALYAQLRTEARAKVPVRFSFPGRDRVADVTKAPLEYVRFTAEIISRVKGVTCRPTGAQPDPGADALGVTSAIFDWARPGSIEKTAGTNLIALNLVLMPGGAPKAVTVCNGPDGRELLTLFHTFFFTGGFWDMHQDEKTDEGLLITDWQRGDALVYARKSYSRAGTCVEALRCSERTTLELRHKPQ